jgi:hypothetical protein
MEKLICSQSSLLRLDILADKNSLWLASVGQSRQVANMNSMWFVFVGSSGHVSNIKSL